MVKCWAHASFLPLFVAIVLTGCTSAPTSIPRAVSGFSGKVHGGQQPVVGATVQLYAVGTTGDGSPATPLLNPTAQTDSNGSFNITGLYTCPTNTTLVYLVATGGQPSPGINNPQISLMAAVGPCGPAASTYVDINEVTTVAAVYALAPYMTSPSAIGSSSTDLSALTSAFTVANEFANTSTGTSPGVYIYPGAYVPSTQINTLADILSACINSPGGVSADSSCGTLFSLVTPTNGTPPTDTVDALLDLALNPDRNTIALYNLVPAASPFQPVQAMAPPDFTVQLQYPVNIFYPSSLSFPATTIGSTSILSVNINAANVKFTSVTIVGANASDFSVVTNPPSNCSQLSLTDFNCSYGIQFTPTAAGVRNAYFVMYNTSQDPELVVSLSGTGTAPASGAVSVSPSSLAFTQFGVPQTVTLTNGDSTTLTINSIAVSNTTFEVYTSTCGATLAPGASCTIPVVATSLATGGSGTLTISDSDSTSPQQVTLGYTAAQSSELAFPILFGHTAIGASSSTGFLEILAPGGVSGSFSWSVTGTAAADFVVSSVNGGAPGTCSYDYRADDRCFVIITFTPSATGLRTASLDITGGGKVPLVGNGDSAGPDFDLFTPNQATGGNLDYLAPITSLDFPSTQVGGFNTQALSVFNTGTVSSLTLATPVISGPNASDFSVGSCTVGQSACSITFTPSATGTRSATVTFEDSTGAVVRALALTGS